MRRYKTYTHIPKSRLAINQQYTSWSCASCGACLYVCCNAEKKMCVFTSNLKTRIYSTEGYGRNFEKCFVQYVNLCFKLKTEAEQT